MRTHSTPRSQKRMREIKRDWITGTYRMPTPEQIAEAILADPPVDTLHVNSGFASIRNDPMRHPTEGRIAPRN